ncbi:contractile injection system protein, VgrG/Pvc8 family [Pseudobacteroides cellulosolvens]|uniref:Gp5/Type VI secretion system Vgr protein OB-fold domain-containing protein n=1 Tax=Pseudobacteroides cellulosolvens ATCC 35603 = DSM 2933 TaxID=398512 RepID=A0A0L6JX87_9FIRM|nr:contractile injection system protein, VgrG/Pvc8 family [Pseudobacteroides cellulosolvens]KNY30468.1 hypothetical protein Bccel_5748 [Pseudobacteroides cellulosolvens ATCC 35603 = DSM 2933]
MGSKTTIAYGNVKIKSPYEIKTILNLRMEKSINDHAKIYISGIISDENKAKYVEQATIKDVIEVTQTDDNSATTKLFKGIVTEIQIKAARGVYYIDIVGASSTFNMDIKLKRRSFQDKNMAYTDLVKKVIADYPGDSIDIAAKGKKLEKFIIQYDETDWAFLRRMASHFNTGLVADHLSDKPKFWFGIPEGGSKGNLEEFNYSVSRRVEDYRQLSENRVEGIDTADFTYFEVETDKILSIGDTVSFNNITLYVYRSSSYIKSSVLRHLYYLAPKKGLTQDLLLNDNACNKAVEGKVIEVKEDNVRVHLDIDKEQPKDKAFWFPYSTTHTSEGNTGWYCMPELDDKVKLYFPTNKEEEGVIVDSVRRRIKGGDKIQKPDEKYFRTKFKKENKFTEKELAFSAKDDKVLISMHEDKGIEILCDSELKIKSENDLIINADKINMEASKGIDIVCNSSSIKMDGKTDIKGSLVKIRC